MKSRRSFFKALASFMAVVAVAPEICFKTKLALPAVEPASICWIPSKVATCQSEAYRKWLDSVLKNNPTQ